MSRRSRKTIAESTRLVRRVFAVDAAPWVEAGYDHYESLTKRWLHVVDHAADATGSEPHLWTDDPKWGPAYSTDKPPKGWRVFARMFGEHTIPRALDADGDALVRARYFEVFVRGTRDEFYRRILDAYDPAGLDGKLLRARCLIESPRFVVDWCDPFDPRTVADRPWGSVLFQHPAIVGWLHGRRGAAVIDWLRRVYGAGQAHAQALVESPLSVGLFADAHDMGVVLRALESANWIRRMCHGFTVEAYSRPRKGTAYDEPAQWIYAPTESVEARLFLREVSS